MPSKTRKITGQLLNKQKKEKSSKTKRPLQNEFRWLFKQVEDLGNSKLKGIRKKLWEKKKLKERGSLARKEVKMPYKMRMGMVKKQKEREEKLLQKEKERGVVVHSLQKENKGRKTSLPLEDYLKQRNSNRSGSFRNVGDGTRGLKTSVGVFKDGVLFIPPSLLKQFPTNRTPAPSTPKHSKKPFNKLKKKKKY